jgi:hypothetical protein
MPIENRPENVRLSRESALFLQLKLNHLNGIPWSDPDAPTPMPPMPTMPPRKADRSAREAVVIYIGNVLFGVKWRNLKLLLRETGEDTYAVREMEYPSIYNLIVDPKEEVPERNYLNDTRVDFPLYQVLEDHEASIEADPGAPDP